MDLTAELLKRLDAAGALAQGVSKHAWEQAVHYTAVNAVASAVTAGAFSLLMFSLAVKSYRESEISRLKDGHGQDLFIGSIICAVVGLVTVLGFLRSSIVTAIAPEGRMILDLLTDLR